MRKFAAICSGHDSKAQGAVSCVDPTLTEWVVCKDIAVYTVSELVKKGIQTEHIEDTLLRSVRRINEIGPGLAVDIHLNASPHTNKTGHSVLVWKNARVSLVAARKILSRLDGVRKSSEGICLVERDQRWYNETYHTTGEQRLSFLQDVWFPSVIVECCFLSNADEARWIAEDANRKSVGIAIARGIVDFLDGSV